MKIHSTDRSQSLFKQAQQRIPGGVNSPVRAFGAVGGTPRFMASGKGCRLWDVDGNEYIDYVGSWGPMILGHAHPEVTEAVHQAVERGTSYGTPTELEVELAELICGLVPSLEKVRLVSSGTEATMSALRVARAYTGRPKVVKFDGCYHGHADSFLVQAGSGVATLGLPNTPGVPQSFTQHTISVPFNDLARVEQAFERYPEEIAAVIIEPVSGNMGVIVPPLEYLKGLLELASAQGAVVIFDEVMTGFRLAVGGAQERFSLDPPMTCLGKIVGGGMPIGAFGGKAALMDLVAPQGAVYQAGTLSGNPVAVTAGLKTLEILKRDNPYPELERRTRRLCDGFEAAAAAAGIPVVAHQCGSMFTLFFTSGAVVDFDSVKQCDTRLFSRFYSGMLAEGVYLAPSQFEASFLSVAHDEAIVDETVAKAAHVLRNL